MLFIRLIACSVAGDAGLIGNSSGDEQTTIIKARNNKNIIKRVSALTTKERIIKTTTKLKNKK